MRKYLIGLTVLFALVVVTPAKAEYYDGNRMMEYCKDTQAGESAQSIAKYNKCVPFLGAVLDTYDILRRWDVIDVRVICRPLGVSQEQLRQVFLNHMNVNPRAWHDTAAGLALDAFEEAWPCKE